MTNHQITEIQTTASRMARRIDELERTLREARIDRDEARMAFCDLITQLNSDRDEVEYNEKSWMRCGNGT